MNRLIWAVTPAIYGLLGMLAGYLVHRDYVLSGTVLGLIAGFFIAKMSVVGEKDQE